MTFLNKKISFLDGGAKQLYQKAVDLINPLIECVEKRMAFGKKTSERAIKLKCTLDITKHFLRENNLKAAQLTLMKHGDISVDLKKIFYNDKHNKSETCKVMCDFLEEMKEISQ